LSCEEKLFAGVVHAAQKLELLPQVSTAFAAKRGDAKSLPEVLHNFDFTSLSHALPFAFYTAYHIFSTKHYDCERVQSWGS